MLYVVASSSTARESRASGIGALCPLECFERRRGIIAVIILPQKRRGSLGEHFRGRELVGRDGPGTKPLEVEKAHGGSERLDPELCAVPELQ